MGGGTRLAILHFVINAANGLVKVEDGPVYARKDGQTVTFARLAAQTNSRTARGIEIEMNF